MPIDKNFALEMVQSMQQSGWQVEPVDIRYPNPIQLEFIRNGQELAVLVHARETTPQHSKRSDHNRPAGEMHAQMIFDGDIRGRGQRNYLRFLPGVHTVLFGFWPRQSGTIIAAYDPTIHREYAYSKSLQVKETTMRRAANTGLAFQLRRNGETIVTFPIDELESYLLHLDSADFNLHSTTHDTIEAIKPAVSSQAKTALTDDESVDPPELIQEERQVVFQEIARKVRSTSFTKGIRAIYERCAICGFQYDYVLDAAHIIPVAEGGHDTYENGLGLCPNCHRMYDKGFILVNGDYTIFLNPRYAEEYDEIGRADSLNDLKHRLRPILWLPDEERYHPSPENLALIFQKRR